MGIQENGEWIVELLVHPITEIGGMSLVNNSIVETVLSLKLKEVQKEKDPIGESLMKAFLEYTQCGGRLSDLSWFKSLNFQELELMSMINKIGLKVDAYFAN